MQYAKPKITRIFNAVSAIKSAKVQLPDETGTHFLSIGPAYQSDE